MIDTPQIVQAVPQQVAVIRFTIPREQMPRAARERARRRARHGVLPVSVRRL